MSLHRPKPFVKFITLNISGSKFMLTHDLLQRYPDSLLGQLVKCNRNFNNFVFPKEVVCTKFPDEFHVSRSPKLFDDVVLQYYVSGKLHAPETMCKEIVKEEIEFWKLDSDSSCSCFSNINDFNDITENNKDRGSSEKTNYKGCYNKGKGKLWSVFDSDSSTTAATIFAILNVMFIFISIMNLIVSSIPELTFCNGTKEVSISDVDDYQNFDIVENVTTVVMMNSSTSASDNANNDDNNGTNVTVVLKDTFVWGFLSNCEDRRVFEVIDMVCIAWFTLEFLLRFFSCLSKLDFVRSPLNWIDFFATFPYYVEIGIFFLAADESILNRGTVLVFSFSRSLTILRILKLARYFKDLRVLGQTFKEASHDLTMMIISICVALLLFGTILYDLEKDMPNTQFTSIPASCWWGIVTLTTVGYGDMTPTTTGGKIVGCVACVSGILIMAMPVSAMVEHFNNVYKKYNVAAARSAYKENFRNEAKEKIILIKNQLRVKNLKRLVKRKYRFKRKYE